MLNGAVDICDVADANDYIAMKSDNEMIRAEIEASKRDGRRK